MHYALATEKSYRHWIVEFLRFRHVSGEWRHPADMGKETYKVLLGLGHVERDARKLLDAALTGKKKYKNVEALLQAVYQQSHGE